MVGQKTVNAHRKEWHCLTVFYAKKNIAALLKSIGYFFDNNKDMFEYWSIHLSTLQGECVNIAFVANKQNSPQAVVLIEEYFEIFLDEHPSEDIPSVSYGSIVWIPYPNNSLVWNAFSITDAIYGDPELRHILQSMSNILIEMYDENASCDENAVSIATLLRIKLMKIWSVALPEVEDPDLADTLRAYWDFHVNDHIAEFLKYFGTQKSANTSNRMIRFHLNYKAPDLIDCHLEPVQK